MTGNIFNLFSTKIDNIFSPNKKKVNKKKVNKKNIYRNAAARLAKLTVTRYIRNIFFLVWPGVAVVNWGLLHALDPLPLLRKKRVNLCLDSPMKERKKKKVPVPTYSKYQATHALIHTSWVGVV